MEIDPTNRFAPDPTPSAKTPQAEKSAATARLGNASSGSLCEANEPHGFVQQVQSTLLDTVQNLFNPSRVQPQGCDGPQSPQIPGGAKNYDHGMFHKGDGGAPDTFAFENSPEGIKFAKDHGYSTIDLDMQITKGGVPVNTH